jgi:thymidylate kinase
MGRSARTVPSALLGYGKLDFKSPLRQSWRMILIIEGADLVGKSTLAERCAAAYGWPISKMRYALKGDPAIESEGMATATIDLLQALEPDVIFDRIYFSLWAYGPALGYDMSYMSRLIQRFARIKDARLVLLTASSDEIRRRYEREPDLYFSLDVIQQANERFPSLLPLLPASLPALHIDTTTTSPDEVFEQVKSFIGSDLPTRQRP